ncbi:hypothetical protein AHF37_11615 [Paragonimus kellicotti]|nr:hypothetical protein AHF37_11615 [Paragonimus kellicotti]
MTLSAACGPPGGGRNPLTPRLVRHFSVLAIPPPSEASLKQIFLTILKGFLRDFSQTVRGATEAVVSAAVEIYVRMAKELLPTPTKSHYVFNLRDLSKCIQACVSSAFYHCQYLDDYNMVMSKEVKLVFFMDAMEHVCRIARMIRQDRGNALLVGVGGTGKQSLTR